MLALFPSLDIRYVLKRNVGNFHFRYFLLGKRPTIIKAVCALVVCVAEVASLIPTLVSGLETQAQRQEDGGAQGTWRIIWPLFFISSLVS